MAIEIKDKVYGPIILILVAITGVQLTEDNTADLFYCEVENSLKECSSLSKYGVEDAKCIGTDGINDICTADGIKYPWMHFNNYIDLTPDNEIVVESIQDCSINYYNETQRILYSCFVNETYTTCYNYTEVTRNYTTCEPLGFNVSYKDKSYEIKGDCCGYFNNTNEIICKEKVNNICNPVCQQTSDNPEIYDEYCMIYKITDKDVVPKLVGAYDYVNNYQKKLAEFKQK